MLDLIFIGSGCLDREVSEKFKMNICAISSPSHGKDPWGEAVVL